MGLLKDLFSENISEMRNMWETINRLNYRVSALEQEKEIFHDYMVEKMDCIENNFADQIAEKCYVKVVGEENLLYLLSEIKKHKKGVKK